MKIYAIDDHWVHAKIYEELFHAETFTKPGEFFTRLCEERPDIVITDLMMPQIDGWTVATIVRSLYPNTPILIATCLDDGLQKRCAENKGFFYWQKGDLTTLRAVVQEMQTYV